MTIRKNASRLTAALLALALITMAAGEALAQKQGTRRAPRGDRESTAPGEMRLERMAERLDLSEEQQAAIGALQAAAREKNLELRKGIERARHELKGELLKDRPDEPAVVRLTERVGQLRTELQVNRAKTRLAVREHLSPEQRDQMILGGQSRGRGGRGAEGWQRGGCCLHDADGGPRRGPGMRSGRI